MVIVVVLALLTSIYFFFTRKPVYFTKEISVNFPFTGFYLMSWHASFGKDNSFGLFSIRVGFPFKYIDPTSLKGFVYSRYSMLNTAKTLCELVVKLRNK